VHTVQAITYARIDIIFPETKSTGPALINQIFLGRRSDQTPELKFTLNHPPLYLLPNQSLDISLTSHYNEMKKLIEGRHSPIDDVNQIRIGLGEAMFVDETLYFGGRIFKRNPDPNGSSKWIKVSTVGRAFGLAMAQRVEYRRRRVDSEPGSLVGRPGVPAEGWESEC